MIRSFAASALAAAVLLLASAGTSPAGDAIVGNCSNDTELRNTIAAVQGEGGGNITFSCQPSTIPVTAPFPVPGHLSIDGENKIILSGGNSSRLFDVGGGGVLTLKAVILTKGSSASDGGAISNQGSLFLQHVKIQDSVSGGSGGAIVTYGTTIITDSEFANNKAINGGAIYPRFPGAQVSIENSNIHHNQATGAVSSWGGAILIWDGASVAVSNSSFHDNTARTGGAVHNMFANSSFSAQSSTFESNSATGDDGGAIYAIGPLTITDSTFSLNSTYHHGGGIEYRGQATSKIARSLFVQ